ncbi:glutamyl-tRNA reductase [Candidatus Saganbacteria bacterium]|uniref:Glutamyl-tRNA reductase n=1 Tax=Candidatus Saganbacteria bacterium TaxID=2575572 RepID=A0A9D6UMK1_UNCSA|nr:glutamyl-tRNA reductase [Candidatus Saganbacteria bacterium]
MELRLLGLSHKTAPVEVREKVAIAPQRLKEALKFFLSGDGEEKHEVVILSTCNRTEIYTVSESFKKAFDFLENYFQIYISEVEKHLYHYSGVKAAEHLMRVASGLDSMIVGEGQVLGQVKGAWQAAQELKTTHSLLNALFNRAISCGKRSRSETKINQGAVSVGSAAVELAKKIFGDLELRQVLIIGAGKMSEVAARLLKSQVVFVANRTFFRAEELAAKIVGKAIKFDELDDYLKTCDIVISSTGSAHYIITQPRIHNVLEGRKNNPLFLIDIAVPRDVDPRVGELSSVYLYDIDDLNAVAAENLKGRQLEIPKVEKIIEEEKENFIRWHKGSMTKRKSLSAPAEAA